AERLPRETFSLSAVRRRSSKISVASGAVCESCNACRAFSFEDARAVVPLFLERRALRQSELEVHGASIGAQRKLREGSDRACHFFGGLARLAVRNDPLAESDAQALVSVDPAAGHDELEGASFPHQAGQPHGAAIGTRHAPAP